MNDPHIQYAIQEAKRIKEEREKRNLISELAPTEANTSTSIDLSTTRESDQKNITNSDDKKFSLFESYNSLLKNHPFIVNSIQSSVLQALGVIISQAISLGNPNSVFVDFNWIDWLEVKVMVTITLVFITPTLIWFYGVLERAKLGVLASVGVDQFLFSPIFTAAIIASRLYYYNSVELQGIWPQLSSILPNALVSGWCFWIPARFLILSLFPPDFHLPMSSVFALLWNVVFAMILSGKK